MAADRPPYFGGLMPDLHTVIDTNVYIGLGSDALASLAERERVRGVESLSSVWPCLELLAHCAATTDPAHRRALAALPRVWQHAGYESRDGPRVRMLEDADSMLARGLFGHQLQDRFLEHGFAAGLIRDAVVSEPETFASGKAAELAAVAERVREEEVRFGEALAQLRASANSDTAEGLREALRSQEGLELVARTRVQTLAMDLGLAVTDSRASWATRQVLTTFPIAVHFLRDVLVDLLACDTTPADDWNRNSVWDLKIAFHASPGASVAGVPVLLVTGDHRLLRAARGAGQPARVATPAEYSAMLDDRRAFADRVAALLGTA